MATTKAKRDANKIVELADEILASVAPGTGSYLREDDHGKLTQIRDLAAGLDASTGKRDTSTKKKRRSAAKKGKKRAGSGR